MLAKVVLFEKRALKAIIIIKWALGHLAQDLYKYSYNSNSRKYFLPFFIRAQKKIEFKLAFDKQVSNDLPEPCPSRK